jgi:ankyrin repeat protein
MVLLGITASLFFGCALLSPAAHEEGGPVPAEAAPASPRSQALFQAAGRGDLQSVRDILERSPSLIDQEDDAGWTAAAYAAWSGNKTVYDYLLAQGATTSVFTEAALGPLPELVRRLQANPLGVNARDARQGATPLIWAARTGNQAAVEYLLDVGADIDAQDRSGATALHAAVRRERLEITETLLSARADPSLQDAQGRTPLHLAADSGSLQFCTLLVEAGAALEARDGGGNTPLHLAAAGGDFELCEYLVFVGAWAAARHDRGLTPAEVARNAGHESVAALLRANNR